MYRSIKYTITKLCYATSIFYRCSDISDIDTDISDQKKGYNINNLPI